MKETIITKYYIMSKDSNNNNMKSKHHKFKVQNIKQQQNQKKLSDVYNYQTLLKSPHNCLQYYLMGHIPPPLPLQRNSCQS